MMEACIAFISQKHWLVRPPAGSAAGHSDGAYGSTSIEKTNPSPGAEDKQQNALAPSDSYSLGYISSDPRPGDPSTGDNVGQQKPVAELEDKKGKEIEFCRIAAFFRLAFQPLTSPENAWDEGCDGKTFITVLTTDQKHLAGKCRICHHLLFSIVTKQSS